MITKLRVTGGHVDSNLGMIEAIVALHYILSLSYICISIYNINLIQVLDKEVKYLYYYSQVLELN